ncbi:methyl-accepting chemotaxis protein [Burkholderia gladioli]|uniref:methyl-accepting chemotaxis protein n=1 Tax=Burkholderia gladioli TaxID=28095 RepID=UPI00163EC26F|nr:methyl-accepting chemotaxis protein [Burkholderia gladioli]MDN7717960.1 methyl-accepting chemotaxis protein [Burkholderia gladioli]
MMGISLRARPATEGMAAAAALPAASGGAGRATRRAGGKPSRAWSVRATLYAAFAVLLIGTLAIGLFSLWQISRLDESIRSVYEQGHVASHAAESVRGHVLRASRAQKMLLTATTAKERDDLGSDIESDLNGITSDLKTLDGYSDAGDRTMLDAFTKSVAGWSAHLRDFVALIKQQPLDLSQMNWQVGTQDVGLLVETGKLEKQVDALVASRGEAARQTRDASTARFHASLAMIAVMTAALIVLAILIASWVVRRIGAQLGGEPATAKTIAAGIASGDLTQPVRLARRDRGSVLYALDEMQRQLAGTVREIAASAEAIASASGEISTGNLDLSQRTEQQAVALERTSSSMSQLTSTVHQNAENARQASALAQNASDVAEQGGEVVGRVVATMNQIDESAKSIRDIIGTIEGIAFQTNILALNAAVEAARAGENGRGFSVVASEVRTLAQRSATAAKEIRQLIGASVERVANGAQLASDAGRTMEEVVRAVRRVTDIIGEISAASTEQSAGIDEIGRAVEQMDDGTQQNAALVEQAAAAARSLDEQAQALKALVGHFRVNTQA